jgi:hypothetical protein
MRRALILSALLGYLLMVPALSHASATDLGALIENFITRHFPEATSHLWVMNSTQWDGDEMIVDVQTYVVEKQQTATIENRYLLLIIGGELTAAQRIPLNDGTECQPEET